MKAHFLHLLIPCILVAFGCQKARDLEKNTPVSATVEHSGCDKDVKSSERDFVEKPEFLELAYSEAGLVLTHHYTMLNCAYAAAKLLVKVDIADEVIACTISSNETPVKCICPIKQLRVVISGFQKGDHVLKYSICQKEWPPIEITGYGPGYHRIIEAPRTE